MRQLATQMQSNPPLFRGSLTLRPVAGRSHHRCPPKWYSAETDETGSSCGPVAAKMVNVVAEPPGASMRAQLQADFYFAPCLRFAVSGPAPTLDKPSFWNVPYPQLTHLGSNWSPDAQSPAGLAA